MHEAEIETTPEGQVPVDGGWFVLNLAEMVWETVPGFGVARDFEARQWDYFHSPPGTERITVGAGDEPCATLMFGSSDPSRKVEWIANEIAAKHGASVAQTTGRDTEAYGELPAPVRVRAPSPFGPP
jgi:hypothetical protein